MSLDQTAYPLYLQRKESESYSSTIPRASFRLYKARCLHAFSIRYLRFPDHKAQQRFSQRKVDCTLGHMKKLYDVKLMSERDEPGGLS